MAKASRNAPRKPHENRQRSRRLPLLLALVSGILLIAGLGVYLGRPAAIPHAPSTATVDPEQPSFDLTGADPAVIAAVEAAHAAVRQSPRSAAAWGRLGMILSAHNFATEANTCYLRAERLDPHEGRWPYYQGTELCLNDPDVAITKLQRAAELFDSRFTPAQPLRVGTIQTPTRSVSEAPSSSLAQTPIRSASEAPSSSLTVRLRLGELLLRQGRPEEAENQLRRVLQQDPENARAHLNLARLARERGDLQASLVHLSRPMKDVHARKASHLLAAEVYRRLGNDAASDQERQQAGKLPKDPDWPDPLVEEVFRLRTGKQVRLAFAAQLIREGRAAEAAASLREMVQDYPDSDWAWLLFGRALLGQNDLAAAEPPLRTAVKLAPASMETHFYLGVVLLLQGNPEAAAACFRQATVIKPDFAEAHHNLAHCLLRQGNRAGAIEAFRAALNCKPNYVEAHLDLAEVLAQEGKYDDALVHVRHGAQLNPTNPKAKQLLEQLQKMTR